MQRNLYKITHNKDLHVGVNKISFSDRRHDTISWRQSLHGFTLVELLVVISIIALLLSILMPSLQKARDMGRKIVCASNLHTIGVAVMTYNVEYNDYPALTWSSNPQIQTWYWTERIIAAGLIEGYKDRRTRNYYLVNYEAYTCPSYRVMTKYSTETYWTSLSYGYNDIYLSPTLGDEVTDLNKNYLGHLPSGNVITAMESDSIYLNYDYYFPKSLWAEGSPTAKVTVHKRHGGFLNSAWTDGHVENMKIEKYKPVMINPQTQYTSGR